MLIAHKRLEQDSFETVTWVILSIQVRSLRMTVLLGFGNTEM